METKRTFNVNFGNYSIAVTGDMYYRLREWSLDNEIEIKEVEQTYYEMESYQDSARDEYGGDAKPTTIILSLNYCSDFPVTFFKSITFFNWVRK